MSGAVRLARSMSMMLMVGDRWDRVRDSALMLVKTAAVSKKILALTAFDGQATPEMLHAMGVEASKVSRFVATNSTSKIHVSVGEQWPGGIGVVSITKAPVDRKSIVLCRRGYRSINPQTRRALINKNHTVGCRKTMRTSTLSMSLMLPE